MKNIPVLLGLVGLLSVASAHAQLAHRYSFTTDGSDSVGTANGFLAGGATITGGVVTTAGNGNDFLALPTTVGTGITGDFSVETYVTQLGNTPGFASLFSLSSSNGSNGPQNFLLLNPARGNNNGLVQANFRQDQTNPGEFQVPTSQTGLNLNTLYQITLTYTTATGNASVYSQGNLIGTGAVFPGFSLQTATAGGFNGINGGGPFGAGDGSFNGSTTDFRIYSSALTATQVAALNVLGPNASNASISLAVAPEPSTWAMMLLSVGALCGLQRFRRGHA